MWWEYLIILAGLAMAAAYAIWFFCRAFSGKGGCGSAACKCGEQDSAESEPLGIKTTPLVDLGTPADKHDT